MFGSLHTHACVWNENNTAIDGCVPVEGLCARPAAPSNGGTIMSYCSQHSVGVNFSLGFGLQPGNIIRNNFSNSNCLLSISGPSEFCLGDTKTYSVINAPAGFTWNKSSNLSISGSGSSIKVSATSGGNGWLSINYGSTELVRYNVIVSTMAPGFTSISGPTIITPSGNSIFYESYFSNGGTPTYYEWSISGAPSSWYDITCSGGSAAYLYFYGEATYSVGVWASNACGCDDGYINVEAYNKNKSSHNSYPNPVDDILTVEIDEKNAQLQAKSLNIKYDIRLYDVFGALYRQTTTKGGKVQLDVSNLPNGFYYLHIYDGVNDKPDMQTIVVKHK